MGNNTLTISNIAIYKSSIRLKEPFVISLGSLASAENIIVIIYTQEGIKGCGECSPFQTIHGETASTCFAVGEMIARKMIGEDPLQISDLIAGMDFLIYGNSSIKSAFDMALYDIASQFAGLPLYKYLGGNKNKIVQTDYTVSIGTAVKMAEDAMKIVLHGFPVIKVKLGGRPEDDQERIQEIRRTVGMDIPIRIDANQGWESSEALHTLHALSKYNIQHCEEPIARWNFMHLPLLKKESPIPIMADESCFDHHDAARLIELEACHSLNVKLGKSGGIFKALKIIELAENAGMKMQMGGFLESRLGFTASAHVSLCSDQIIHYDFDTPLMFNQDPVLNGIAYGWEGIITVPDLPGLGASFDTPFLDSLPKISIS